MRMAGVNVGKVKTKELDKGGARTIVEIEIKRAVRADPARTRARSCARRRCSARPTSSSRPGDRQRPARSTTASALPNAQVRADGRARRDLRRVRQADPRRVPGLGRRSSRRRSRAARPGPERRLRQPRGLRGRRRRRCSRCSTSRRSRSRRLVKNTGVVFGAINEREGALRELIVNSNNTFEATASRDAGAGRDVPRSSRPSSTSRRPRWRGSSASRANTRPLVNDLKGPADDLGPTVRDLGDLAPDLEALFRDLPR